MRKAVNRRVAGSSASEPRGFWQGDSAGKRKFLVSLKYLLQGDGMPEWSDGRSRTITEVGKQTFPRISYSVASAIPLTARGGSLVKRVCRCLFLSLPSQTILND